MDPRSRDKKLLELFVEEGHVFVLSATRQSKDWLISEAPGGSAKAYVARVRTHPTRHSRRYRPAERPSRGGHTCRRGRGEDAGARVSSG